MFPLRRRVMPRRGWHNEEWSRQWLQLLMGPRPPSVQWPRSRPRQPPKGSGKGRGRSQPLHSEVPVPKPTVSTTRTSPAESESQSAAKLAKLEAAHSALDQESPEAKFLKSVIDKTRVRAGHGHPGKRLDECQQYMARAAKRLEIAKQAVVAAVAEQDRLQEEYNVGSARLEELKKEASATPFSPRWRWMATQTESDNSKPWFQSSAGKGTICDRTVQRRSERARLWQTPQF